MKEVYYLLRCFGERYINCDNQEAVFDAETNRENLVGAYNAILDYAGRIMED